jgi:hypothetical protein
MRLMRLPKQRPVVQPSWTRPADDLWIASVDGEFAGMIEFTSGHFVTTDRTGGLIDNFSGIPQAMQAIASQRPA